jgi:hypothetical protein
MSERISIQSIFMNLSKSFDFQIDCDHEKLKGVLGVDRSDFGEKSEFWLSGVGCSAVRMRGTEDPIADLDGTI